MSVRKAPKRVFGCFHPKVRQEHPIHIMEAQIEVLDIPVTIDVSTNGIDVTIESDIVEEMKDICHKLKRVNTLEAIPEVEVSCPPIPIVERKKKIDGIKIRRSIMPKKIVMKKKEVEIA